MINFYDTVESKLKTHNFESGSIYICRDSKKIYVDSSYGGNRIDISGSIETIDTETNREAMSNPVDGKLYLVLDSKKLYAYVNGWIAISGAGSSQRRIPNQVIPSTGELTVAASGVTASNTGIFIPDSSVADLVSNIVVTCATDSVTVTATTEYDIPGEILINC